MLVAETFAPVVECLLFWTAFGFEKGAAGTWRDGAVIVGANLASFGLGLRKLED